MDYDQRGGQDILMGYISARADNLKSLPADD